MSTTTETAGPPRMPARADIWIVALAAVLLGGGALLLLQGFAWRQAALYLLGALLGLTLYHATFGFAASWRRFLADGRGDGLRAQMVMLALATLLFFPVLGEGSLFGQRVTGAVAPAGVSVLVGAFVFGLGMQLGGGCASGTLYTVGGGSARMTVTLLFFVVGSLVGSAHLPWWLEAPRLGAISLPRELGLYPALALQLGLLAAIAAITIVIERRRHGRLERDTAASQGPGWRRLWQGPWPLLAGAAVLALLNFATLALAGHPWSVSFGYALWGAKAGSALGLDVAGWTFWTWPFPKRALEGSIFANSVSLMNFGIVAGAFLAAGLAGRFRPASRVPWPSLLVAALGGILMGYGARLAFGCNVGGYFSGIASGSLHGWLWLVAGLAGTYVGLRLRPAFGLSV
jgi:uncharacterized membrane protein YedE/YeeE